MGKLFLTWLKLFSESIPPSRPVLLILDGHASHVSIEAIEFARSNDIHMLYIPAHTTHILQPLDVGVFKSFKSFYAKACKKRISEHPNRVITQEKKQRDIAQMLQKHNEETHQSGETLPEDQQLYRVCVVSAFLRAGTQLNKIEICWKKVVIVSQIRDRCMTTYLSFKSVKR